MRPAVPDAITEAVTDKESSHVGSAYLLVLDQWDPTSPWHDRRVRLAANLAIDKQAIGEAVQHGIGRLTGSIVPSTLAFALPLEPFPYDLAQAKRLLAEAGYPKGLRAAT